MSNLVLEPYFSGDISNSDKRFTDFSAEMGTEGSNSNSNQQNFIIDLKISSVMKGEKLKKKHRINLKIGTENPEILNFIGQPVENLITTLIERRHTKPSTFFYLKRKNIKDFYDLVVVEAQDRGENFWIISPFGIANFHNNQNSSSSDKNQIEALSLAEFYRHKAAYTLLKTKNKFFNQTTFIKKYFNIWLHDLRENRKLKNLNKLARISWFDNKDLYKLYVEEFKLDNKEGTDYTELSLLSNGKRVESSSNLYKVLSEFTEKLISILKNKFNKIVIVRSELLQQMSIEEPNSSKNSQIKAFIKKITYDFLHYSKNLIESSLLTIDRALNNGTTRQQESQQDSQDCACLVFEFVCSKNSNDLEEQFEKFLINYEETLVDLKDIFVEESEDPINENSLWTNTITTQPPSSLTENIKNTSNSLNEYLKNLKTFDQNLKILSKNTRNNLNTEKILKFKEDLSLKLHKTKAINFMIVNSEYFIENINFEMNGLMERYFRAYSEEVKSGLLGVDAEMVRLSRMLQKPEEYLGRGSFFLFLS